MTPILYLDDYQAAAMATAGDLLSRTAEEGIVTAALGLAGEAGEFADVVKKWWAQGHDLDLGKLDKEAGDVLWYLARYAHARGRSLSELATENVEKLAARYAANGGKFSAEISKARYETCVGDGMGEPSTCQTHMADWYADEKRCRGAVPA